jgi:hypothetical protein
MNNRKLEKLYFDGLNLLDVVVLNRIIGATFNGINKTDILEGLCGDRNFSRSKLDRPIEKLLGLKLIKTRKSGRSVKYLATAKTIREYSYF